MGMLSTFWILFLIDSLMVLFSFTIFVCIWISTMFYFCIFFIFKLRFIYLSFDFISAKYIDVFWFTIGMLFVLTILLSLCLLLYFSSLSFVCFDLCKCIGFQWYWVYYLFSETTIFSNLILESDYWIGDLRILQCNNILTLLSMVMYKFWVTSTDVIHSFTLSSLGMKVEMPGSCNELLLFSSGQNTFYGQCSELCGVLHGFMPMMVNFV